MQRENRRARNGIERVEVVKVGDNMAKEIYMEDISDIALEVMKLIEDRLKEFDLTVPEELEDTMFNPIMEVLEKVAKYPYYRHEH